jgi:hypothetical protein
MERTAQEAKEDAIKAMGTPLGEIYSALWQEIAIIHSTWAEYVALFGTKESRIHLMNQAAPRFTRLVQDTLWESVILHIARLTDPPQSMGKENLSVQSLPKLVDRPDTQESVASLVTRTISETAFARDWRNRHLAHRDLQLALNRPADPLKAGSRLAVKTVLATFAELLNTISFRYTQSTTYFDFHADMGGAISLLHIVDDGLRAEAARRDRLLRGEALPDDYKPRDL